jgi:hypothetical protein
MPCSVGSHAAHCKPRGQKGGVGKLPNAGEEAPIFVDVFGIVTCHWKGNEGERLTERRVLMDRASVSYTGG